ncbi:tetratricopeptide (TPR) repeat protein [Neisseria sp. HSC-16F19]|nr:hypothetical protein [Neisseria sp. HSC-16F19]MCP2041102.1 tetratricopeptide (TPR) repeat protein [Neisseria sp. HSC-16F19]
MNTSTDTLLQQAQQAVSQAEHILDESFWDTEAAMEHYQSALSLLEEVLQAEPQHDGALALRLDILMSMGHHYGEAGDGHRRDVEMISDSVTALWQQSRDCYERALQLYPERYADICTVYFNHLGGQGDQLFGYGQDEEAFALLEKMVGMLRPGIAWMHWATDFLYDAAILIGRHADGLAAHDPQQAFKEYHLAIAALMAVKHSSAMTDVAMSVLSMYIRAYQANTVRHADQLQEAIRVFEELGQQYPECLGEMYYNRACIAALMQQMDEAVHYLGLSHQAGALPPMEEVLADTDLAALRETPEYEDFVGYIARLG